MQTKGREEKGFNAKDGLFCPKCFKVLILFRNCIDCSQLPDRANGYTFKGNHSDQKLFSPFSGEEYL